MNDGLKDKHRQAIIDILAAHPGVERAVLFGSRAMGTFTSASDVDIALFGDSLTMTDQARLADAIDKLTIPQRVDLLRYKTIKNKALLKHIEQHGITLHEKTTVPAKTGKRGTRGSEWRRYAVADLIADGVLIINDGYRAKNSELSTEGLPFARAGNINNGFNFVDADKFPTDDLHKVGIKTSQAGDVVFTSKGTVGRFAFVRPDTPRFVFAPQLCFWRVNNRDVIAPRYLYYWMFGREFYVQFSGVKGQTDMADYVSLRDQRVMHITLPSLPAQHAIAHVLGTLDDKIELNRRMNETLEAMAAAIFKSWFIDFDPVHAKADGRDPGLPKEIANLFPNTFEDSKLGPIPKGWLPSKLGNIADNPRRGVKPEDVPPATPYIGLQDMPRRSIALDSWGRADEVGSGKYQFRESDILFGKLRPYFHKVGIAPVDGVCSTDILLVAPKSENWHSYVLSLVSSKAFVDYTDAHSAGTKMPRTNWKDMSRYPLALPSVELARAFQGYIAVLHQRIVANVQQNHRLANLRDTLLPQLLSGEICVPKAEKIVEEVL